MECQTLVLDYQTFLSYLYHKSSSHLDNYYEFKLDNGRRYHQPRSDVTEFNVSASKQLQQQQQHRMHYKSSHDPAHSLQHHHHQHPQYAQQHVTPANSNSFNASRQQRHDGKKMSGRHGHPLTESSELQSSHHNKVSESVLPLGFDPTAGSGYSGQPPPYYDMDARAGRHFPHHEAVAEAEVLQQQQQQQHSIRQSSYQQPPNGTNRNNNRFVIRQQGYYYNKEFLIICDQVPSTVLVDLSAEHRPPNSLPQSSSSSSSSSSQCSLHASHPPSRKWH